VAALVSGSEHLGVIGPSEGEAESNVSLLRSSVASAVTASITATISYPCTSAATITVSLT